MMRKTLLVGMLAGAMMMFGLTACGNTVETVEPEPEVQEVVVEEPVEEPVVQETFASLNGCLESEYDGKMYFSCLSTKPEYSHQETVVSVKSLKVSNVDGGYQYDFKFKMDCTNFAENKFIFNYGFVDTYTGEDYTLSDKVNVGDFAYTYESDDVETFTCSVWVSDDVVGNLDLVFTDVDDEDVDDEDFLLHFNYSLENGEKVTFMHLPDVELEFVRAN